MEGSGGQRRRTGQREHRRGTEGQTSVPRPLTLTSAPLPGVRFGEMSIAGEKDLVDFLSEGNGKRGIP